MKSILSLLFAFLLLVPSLTHAHGDPSDGHHHEVTAELISETTHVGKRKVLWLALDVNLAEGWHTYWKLPGETGEPPHLDWSQSTNIEKAELLYPAPKRIKTFDTDIIGYEDHVIFPIKVTLKEAGKETLIQPTVTLLACKNLCVPITFTFSKTIFAGPYNASSYKDIINKAIQKIPSPNEKYKLNIVRIKRLKDGFEIKVSAIPNQMQDPDLFIYNPEGVLFKRPVFDFSPCKRSAVITAKLQEPLDEGLSMDTLPLTVSYVDGDKMLEEMIPNADKTHVEPCFCTILFLAFLGGLILNLMPCVLPVLSLKLMSALRQSGQEKKEITRSFLATSAGIITSFMALAILTIALKYTGQILGWGMQFQQPLFLLFMIFLLVLFAANMWGMFTIPLPSWIANKITKPGLPKLSGDFGTGMFATLLATPCSAPFLGTAISFALTSGYKEILPVFFTLGLGMATPFLLVAFWPSCARLLPRPGNWMNKLSILLGFGLAGTAIWLIFVLKAQVGSTLTMIVEASIISIVILLYLHSREILQRYIVPSIALIILASFITLSLSDPAPQKTILDTQWEAFEESKIEQAIKNGKIVFVDITADWCLNCKFNKKFIISQRDVRHLLFYKRDIISLQGDWTNPDPKLTEFLHKHGRYGIPFNAVYGPSAPNGILLPELLTYQSIKDAVDKAR